MLRQERHYVTRVDESGAVLQKATAISEEATGYGQLRELLADPEDCLGAMEATGHYWRSLSTFLFAEGFSIGDYSPKVAKVVRQC
jgi:transposase